MPKPKRELPVVTGAGVLTFRRTPHLVHYRIESGDVLQTGKGWVTGQAEDMRAAFSAGRAVLTLENDATLPVTFVAYAAANDAVYFEIRRP